MIENSYWDEKILKIFNIENQRELNEGWLGRENHILEYATKGSAKEGRASPVKLLRHLELESEGIMQSVFE